MKKKRAKKKRKKRGKKKIEKNKTIKKIAEKMKIQTNKFSQLKI